MKFTFCFCNTKLFECVSPVPSKAIEVTVEEPKAQTVRVGSTVSFICTAKSKVTLDTVIIMYFLKDLFYM